LTVAGRCAPAPWVGGRQVLARFSGLWRHPDFMKLWTAQTVSSFGARIAREGLPLAAIVALHAGPLAVGIFAALRLGPQVLVGLMAGPLIDRLPRRPVLIAADLARALVLLAIPTAALLHRLTLAEVYAAGALMGSFNVVFDMADHAYLPILVAPSQLLDGNTKLGTTDALAESGGPLIYGGLFSVLAAPVAVGVTGLTYLFSALCLSTIKARPEPALAEDEETIRLFDVAAGLKACLAHPLVRPLLAMEFARTFFGSFYSALYLIYALNVLHLSVLMLGIAVACGGVGGFVGASLTPAITRRLGIGPAIILTGLSAGAVGFLTPLASGPPLIALAFLVAAQFFSDAIATVTEIDATTLRQTVMPPALLSRAAGAFMAAGGLAGVLGAVIGGLVGQAEGARLTLYIAATGIAAAPLLALFSPLWRTREVGADG
jgi:hypothetical protein